MLSIVAIVAGIAAGILFVVAAARQPEKARQLRIQGAFFVGIAFLVAVVTAL